MHCRSFVLQKRLQQVKSKIVFKSVDERALFTVTQASDQQLHIKSQVWSADTRTRLPIEKKSDVEKLSTREPKFLRLCLIKKMIPISFSCFLTLGRGEWQEYI